MNRGIHESAPSHRRRAIGWTIAACLAAAALIWGILWIRSYQVIRRLERCREPVEALESSRRIADFFNENRQALAGGSIDLSGSEDALEGNLRILLRILEDDGLLEAEVHRRSSSPGQRAFSAHAWLAGKEAAPLRSRLLGLMSHPSGGVRLLCSTCLGLLGTKVPEALAAEPLPWFRREHLRSLFGLLVGARPPPTIAIRSFLREILRTPGSLRLWDKGPEPDRTGVLGLAIRAVLGTEGAIDGEFADAIASLEDLPWPYRILQAKAMGRTPSPSAWRRLVHLATSAHPPAVRSEALAALKTSAPIEAIDPLREIASTGGPWAEQARDTVEHITGERMADWSQRTVEPGRMAALRAAPETRAEIDRLVSALRFHGLRPEYARKNPETLGRILAALASPIPEARVEAARTAGRAGIAEAIGGDPSLAPGGGPPAATKPAPREPGAGALIRLLLDPDLRAADAAASALFSITAFWPPEEGGVESQEPGSLSPEVAADPARLGRWALAWGKWRAKDGSGKPADWLLDALESPLPLRSAEGARALSALANRGDIGPPWCRENESRLLKAFPRLSAEAKASILEVLAVLEDPARSVALWGLFEPAFRSDPVDAWEILAAVHRLEGRTGKDEEAVLETLVARLGQADSSAVLIARYLDSRFQASAIDGALLGAIRRLLPAGPGPAGAEREGRLSRLARWFPRSLDRAKALVLVDLLSDPGASVRFWAFQHISALAGQGFGYDTKRPGAEQAESIGRLRSWAEELGDPPLGR